MSLAIIERRLSLDELAARANAEHALVDGALESALAHAIACGDALNEAYAQVPLGEWQNWLAANFKATESWALVYRRVSMYRETLLEHGIQSLSGARTFLTVKSLTLPKGGIARITRALSPEQIKEIRILHERGVSTRKIAEICGVGRSTVAKLIAVNGVEKARQSQSRYNRRRHREKMALRAQETAALAKRAGGSLHEAWRLSSRLAACLDAARRDASGERRRALETALTSCYEVETAVSRALRAVEQ